MEESLRATGLPSAIGQLAINKVAFPDANFVEVDAALKAGNKLRQLYEVASGNALIAQDSRNQYKVAKRGLKIIRLQRRPRH